MEIALLVEFHQVAGTKPGIAFRHHVAQDFLLGLGRVGITLEAAAALVRGSNPADGFADLAACAGNAQTVCRANGDAEIRIDAHDRGRKAVRQQRGNAPNRARLALDVVKRKIAFGRGIEFEDPRDGEARLERLPDIAAQPVAAGEPEPVRGLEFGSRRVEQITAEFADILKYRALPAHDVMPELAD